jgi:hypothetical protein
VYGTVPQFGNTTATQTVAASSIPQTFTVTLTGLTTGDLYYAAFVGQTAGGTVTSSPLTFTPAIPTPAPDASNPTVPTGTPAVTIPHFQYPFTIQGNSAVVVEQQSYEEILSCVLAILACPVGTCPELPTFGYHDPTFQTGPPSANQLLADIQQWEPRADVTAVSAALDQIGAGWGIGLTATVPGTGQ